MCTQSEKLREALELLRLKGNTTDERLFLRLCKTLDKQEQAIKKAKAGKGTMKTANEYGVVAYEIASIMSDVDWCGYSKTFWIAAAIDSNKE